MDPVDFGVSGVEIIFNDLYEDAPIELLMQDLAAIKLADGTFVDIGWYPQFDPAGCYRVSRHDREWGEELGYCVARDIRDVIEAVRRFAGETPAVRDRPIS